MPCLNPWIPVRPAGLGLKEPRLPRSCSIAHSKPLSFASPQRLRRLVPAQMSAQPASRQPGRSSPTTACPGECRLRSAPLRPRTQLSERWPGSFFDLLCLGLSSAWRSQPAVGFAPGLLALRSRRPWERRKLQWGLSRPIVFILVDAFRDPVRTQAGERSSRFRIRLRFLLLLPKPENALGSFLPQVLVA